MARKRINGKSGKIAKKVLEWRAKQEPGEIMSTETFNKIVKGAEKKYGKERALDIAGAAYWRTVKAKQKAVRRKKKTAWKEYENALLC